MYGVGMFVIGDGGGRGFVHWGRGGGEHGGLEMEEGGEKS